jgi:hypothetical protein
VDFAPVRPVFASVPTQFGISTFSYYYKFINYLLIMAREKLTIYIQQNTLYKTTMISTLERDSFVSTGRVCY